MKTIDWLLPWRAKRLLQKCFTLIEQLKKDSDKSIDLELLSEQVRQAQTESRRIQGENLELNRKLRAIGIWIRKAHRLDIPTTEGTIKKALEEAS